MKTNQKEELQSRREFFKKAAKAALPVVGAIVLTQIPTIAQATPALGCTIDACTSTCTGSCKGTCRSCSAGCSKSCSRGCQTTSVRA